MYLKSLDSVENYTSRQWETTKFFSIRLFFFFFYSTIIQYYELRNCMFGMGENSPKMKINNLKGKKKKKKGFLVVERMSFSALDFLLIWSNFIIHTVLTACSVGSQKLLWFTNTIFYQYNPASQNALG